MFYESLMTEDERAIQEEVRAFVREQVPPDLLRALDRDEIQYPREYVQKLAEHKLLDLRFDPKWGGRGLPWTAEVIADAITQLDGASPDAEGEKVFTDEDQWRIHVG